MKRLLYPVPQTYVVDDFLGDSKDEICYWYLTDGKNEISYQRGHKSTVKKGKKAIKFRMDFVTNSSSNSYIVRLSVKPQKDDIIKFDLYPNGGDESNVEFKLRSGVRNVADRIKKCRTVNELTEVLVQENSGGDINSLIENYEEDEWDEDEDEEDRVDLREEVQEKIKKFRNEMSKYSALDEIDSVIISELYTGWGESAYDTVEAYLYRIHPEASQNEIDVMVEELTGGPFIPYGQVDTIINPNDGSVREEHDLSLGHKIRGGAAVFITGIFLIEKRKGREYNERRCTQKRFADEYGFMDPHFIYIV